MHSLSTFGYVFHVTVLNLIFLQAINKFGIGSLFDRNSTKIAKIKAKFAKNLEFSFLKSKNGGLKILLKSNILCTKIFGIVKFFLKSKNFLKSNALKSKIYCTCIASVLSHRTIVWTAKDFRGISV